MTDIYINEYGKMTIVTSNNILILFSYDSKIIEVKASLGEYMKHNYILLYFNDDKYVQTQTTFKHVIKFMKKLGLTEYNYRKLEEKWNNKDYIL